MSETPPQNEHQPYNTYWDDIWTSLSANINKHTSNENLQKQVLVVIDMLFQRPNDEKNKKKLKAIFNQIFIAGSDLEQKKVIVLKAINLIISFRKKIHAELQNVESLKKDPRHKNRQQNTADLSTQLGLPPDDPCTPTGKDNTFDPLATLRSIATEQTVDLDALDTEEQLAHYFEKIFLEKVADKFSIMVTASEEAVPFFMSEEFVTHFLKIVSENILPHIFTKYKASLNRKAEDNIKSPAHEIVEGFFRSDNGKRATGGDWKDAWEMATAIEEMPAEPEMEKKKGRMNAIMSNTKAKKRNDKKRAEWEKKKAKIINTNARNQTCLDALCEEMSEAYFAPTADTLIFFESLFESDNKKTNKNIKFLHSAIEEESDRPQWLIQTAMKRDNTSDLEIVLTYFKHPDLFAGEENSQNEKNLLSALSYRSKLPKNMVLCRHFIWPEAA